MFWTVPLSIIRSISLYTQQWYTSYQFVNSLQAGSGWNCLQAVRKPVWCISLPCVRWNTPDDGQRNCLKHVEFYSKNKSEMSASSWFKVCKSVHHHTFQINQPTWCNNFSRLLLDVYVQLNMFRVSSRPLSGAQQLQ